MQHKPDKVIVEAFVEHLRQNGQPQLQIESFPDEHNRSSEDIDAIACPFAIEHTSIDTVPDQRRSQNWFNKFADALKDALEGEVPFHLEIILHQDSIKNGLKPEQLQAAFETWVRNESPSLPEGRTIIKSAHGIPFEFETEKWCDEPPELILQRLVSTDGTLAECLQAKIEEKARKLRRYHSDYTTVLLIESVDKILMNNEKMLKAICKSYPDSPPAGVDQVWYAESLNSTLHWFTHVTPYLH